MSARTISIFVPPVSVRVFTQPGSFSEVRPHSRRVRFAPTNGHRRLDRLGQKSAMNGRCRRAYIVTQAALGVAPALAPQRLTPRYFQRETETARAWSTLPSCTLPTTRPTLYAEWTDIELVRELSRGRAEVPASYWQRRCCRQASHFNRPTVFLAGAFSHSQSHGRASQHDLFAVTREKRHEDSLFSDIGDAGGLRTRCSRG